MFPAATRSSFQLAAVLVLAASPLSALASDDLFCATGSAFADSQIKVSGGSEIVPLDLTFVLDVRSNGNVVVGGSSLVDGDAYAGDRVRVHGNGVLTGDAFEGETPVEAPDIDSLVETYRHQNDNHAIGVTDQGRTALRGTTLQLRSGDALTIPEGDYFFTRVSVSGGTLFLSGSVRFFVDGDVHLSGHAVANGGAEPADFAILGASARSSVKLSGHCELVGSIVLPRGRVSLTGQSQMWGGVVSGDLQITGGSRLVAQDVCREGPPEIEEEEPASDRCLEWEGADCVQ